MTRLNRPALAALTALMLVPAVAAAAPAFKVMSVSDFFLDRKTLLGRPVEVTGQFQANGDTVFLVLDAGANATFVNVDKVPRDDRKALYERCRQACGATVRGIVRVVPGPIGSDVGIVAQSFTLN